MANANLYTWKEAIVKILEEEKTALHYTKIAELISEREYRTSLGRTPQDTVGSVITVDINKYMESSVFTKVDKGTYILKQFIDGYSQPLIEENISKVIDVENIKIINAFGIHWNRDFVHWTTTPNLLGVQQTGAEGINFKSQIGIYLLHDNREIIYIGQAIGQTLGQRLKNHTSDRLSGRWDRFSWFGFYPVNSEGELNTNKNFENISIQNLGDTLEAILIESIEPRQNRKQGNLFTGLEYLQQEAPEIKTRIRKQLLIELTNNL